MNLKRIATETVNFFYVRCMGRITELLKPQYKCTGATRRPGRLVQSDVYLAMEITLNGKNVDIVTSLIRQFVFNQSLYIVTPFSAGLQDRLLVTLTEKFVGVYLCFSTHFSDVTRNLRLCFFNTFSLLLTLRREFKTLMLVTYQPFLGIKNGENNTTRYEERDQIDATQQCIELVIRSTCFEHHYAHHQELETIQIFTACGT